MSELEAAREATIQLLCRQFALDQLSTEDLDARLTLAQRATSLEALRALTAGLPPLPVRANDATALAALGGAGTVPAERRIVATLSDKKLSGDWELAQHTKVVAVLSALTLDLREARIPAGVTRLDIRAVLSEVKIILPPGIHVECEGVEFLGEFAAKGNDRLLPAAPDAPLLRIEGTATLAEVSVRTRLPDETALAALARDWKD